MTASRDLSQILEAFAIGSLCISQTLLSAAWELSGRVRNH